MKTGAVRVRELREREKRKGIRRIELRVPEAYDVGLQLLAEDLRKGMRLQGLVLRDPKTGRVSTRTI